MSWSVEQKSDRPYVTAVLRGSTSWQDIQEVTASCIALQRERGVTKYLINTTEMRPTASIVDVLELPDSEYSKQHVDRHTQIAVVYAAGGASEEIVTFYEMACTNRGWQAKSFTSEEDAVAWLLGEAPG